VNLIKNKQTNKETWVTAIQEQQVSGKTQKTWCLENNVNIHNFAYWKKRMSTTSNQEATIESGSAFEWASVIIENNTSTSRLEIKVGAVSIYLESDYDEQLLVKLINTLKMI
jgi:hypothetical protein